MTLAMTLGICADRSDPHPHGVMCHDWEPLVPCPNHDSNDGPHHSPECHYYDEEP